MSHNELEEILIHIIKYFEYNHLRKIIVDIIKNKVIDNT